MNGMRCVRITLILLMVLVVGVASAQKEGFPVKDLPREAKLPADFLPRGWVFEQQVSSDLNGDGIADLATILTEDKPDADENGVKNERQRTLMVLLGEGKEKFILAGTNDRLLLCTTCGGVKGGATIEIKKDILIVTQLSGSREFTDETWRFRYDPQSRRFVLIGRDIETGDSLLGTGKVESFNTLTGLKITESYRYERTGERKITISTKREKRARNTPFLEDVEAQ